MSVFVSAPQRFDYCSFVVLSGVWEDYSDNIPYYEGVRPIIKSALYEIIVTNALGYGEDDPPGAYESWVDDVLDAATDAKEARDQAREAQKKAEEAQKKSEEAQKKAEEAQKKAEEAKTAAEEAKTKAINDKQVKNDKINAHIDIGLFFFSRL